MIQFQENRDQFGGQLIQFKCCNIKLITKLYQFVEKRSSALKFINFLFNSLGGIVRECLSYALY